MLKIRACQRSCFNEFGREIILRLLAKTYTIKLKTVGTKHTQARGLAQREDHNISNETKQETKINTLRQYGSEQSRI